MPVDESGTSADAAASRHAQGVAYNRDGRYSHASEEILAAIMARPNAATYYVNLGESYRNLGDYRRAESSCRIALRFRPEFPEALNTLGLIQHQTGRAQEAIDSYKLAISLAPAMAAANNNLGLVLREMGRLDEAISHFERAIEADPEMDPARTNLGLSLVARGRPDEAIEQFGRVAARSPDRAEVHLNLGSACRLANRPVEARASYLQAILLNPEDATSYFCLGLALKDEGRFGEAVAWFQSACELMPDHVPFLRLLAETYRDREEARRALQAWERILEISNEDATISHDAHIGIGQSLVMMGKHRDALEHYRSASGLLPGSPISLFHTGVLHEEMGEMAEAESALRAALDLQPGFPPALSRLGTLLRGDLGDVEFEKLLELSTSSSLDPNPRCRILFALAHVYDGRGGYAEGARCTRQANFMSCTLEADGQRYDAKDHESFISESIRAFDRDFFERTHGFGSTSDRPIFVFGLPRSGTTLVEQILSSHPRAFGAGELRHGRLIFDSIPTFTRGDGSPLSSVPGLDEEAIRTLADQHLKHLRSLDEGKFDRIVNKLPDNYLILGFLMTLFPEAVFIHCRRDLRDIAVSCWMTDFARIRWASTPQDLASRFHGYRRIMDHWDGLFGSRIHEVRYEETVVDLEGVARGLIGACGLDWDANCLEFYKTKRPVRTASVAQVRKPIYSSSVERWRNYERELADLFDLLPEPNRVVAGAS